MKNLEKLKLQELTINEKVNIDGGIDGDFASEIGHIAKHIWKYRSSGFMTMLSLINCYIR